MINYKLILLGEESLGHTTGAQGSLLAGLRDHMGYFRLK